MGRWVNVSVFCFCFAFLGFLEFWFCRTPFLLSLGFLFFFPLFFDICSSDLLLSPPRL